MLLGSSTGRDGIGGVSVLASAGFSGDDAGAADDTKRPSVQVGDPFEEKRLIEACLELLDTKLVVGIQDLGGAGLACATSETAGRGGVGMDVDVSAVPRREEGMEPWEVMTSESQERMLAIVTPESWPAVAAICAKWEVRATVVGTVTEPEPGGGGRLRIRDGMDGPVLADVPAASLSDDAPLYDRPRQAPVARRGRAAGPAHRLRRPTSWPCCARRAGSTASTTTSSSSTPWPGRAPTPRCCAWPAPGCRRRSRGVALTTDSNPRACALDPRRGTALVLAEGVANLACVGATPVAVVNCLNFGNPEHPEVMWQLSECIDGMAEACRALSLPVIGGNVSLYNESGGSDIDPTPVLGVLGLVDAVHAPPPGLAWSRRRHRRAGRAARRGGRLLPAGGDALGHRAPGPPHRADPVRRLRGARRDVCLRRRRWSPRRSPAPRRRAAGARRARRVGRRPGRGAGRDGGGGGHRLHGRTSTTPAELFTELPSRFVVATADPDELCAGPRPLGIPAAVLGRAGGDRCTLGGLRRPPRRRPARGARGEPAPWPWGNRDAAGLCENG